MRRLLRHGDIGQSFGDLFPVTLLVYGKALPQEAIKDNTLIDLVHVLDDGTTVEVIAAAVAG